MAKQIPHSLALSIADFARKTCVSAQKLWVKGLLRKSALISHPGKEKQMCAKKRAELGIEIERCFTE
jgi:hypothetical protein